MTEIPYLWWSPTHGLLGKPVDGGDPVNLLDNGCSPLAWKDMVSRKLPADAVKLGDVKALRQQRDEAVEQGLAVVRERDAYQALWEMAADERDALQEELKVAIRDRNDACAAGHVLERRSRELTALRADIRSAMADAESRGHRRVPFMHLQDILERTETGE